MTPGEAAGPARYFRSTRVVTPQGVAPRSIRVVQGVIEEVLDHGAVPQGAPLVDAGDAAILPGLVDTHVHVNEPGRTEWEGFRTATRAAAAGGITTIVDMPLNSIPATVTGSALLEKRRAASGQLAVDAGFWGGVVPGNSGELGTLWELGVPGFKCFLVPSGVDEFPNVTCEDLEQSMPVLAALGAPLLVHAELPGPIAEAASRTGAPAATTSHSRYEATRPKEAEHEAIALMIRLARKHGTRVHIVHLSSADAVPMLEEARRENPELTVETCPHYLTFASEDVPPGATEFKCAPPIRGRNNREALWRALENGVIDLVASDHSPCPPEMKRREAGDFMAAWGGIASLEVGLAAVWSSIRARGGGLERVAEWMSAAPARLAGLAGRKGAIARGCDADLVVFRPEDEVVVDADRLHQRHHLTPYAGMRLLGSVAATYLRGEPVFGQQGVSAAPSGRVILREAA